MRDLLVESANTKTNERFPLVVETTAFFVSSRTGVRDLVVNTKTNERFLIFIRNDKRCFEDGFPMVRVATYAEHSLEMEVMLVTFL